MLRNVRRIVSATTNLGLFTRPVRALGASTACPYRVSELIQAATDEQYLQSIPLSERTIKAIFSDGAGTSGDERGKGTKAAMTYGLESHFEEIGIKIVDPIKPIEEHNGIGKLAHFKAILKWLKENDSNVKRRYEVTPYFFDRDALAILARMTSEKGVKIIRDHSKPVSGYVEFSKKLEKEGYDHLLQTAYGPAEAAAFREQMRAHGVEFPNCVNSGDVTYPRDYFAMLYKALDYYGYYPWQVFVLGDTGADMRAARDFWGVGLPDNSAFLPNRDMSPEELHRERERVAQMLTQNGAKYVLLDKDWRKPESLSDKVFAAIADANLRMAQGYFPNMRLQQLPVQESKSEMRLGSR